VCASQRAERRIQDFIELVEAPVNQLLQFALLFKCHASP
jgi:hypothetical protein